MLCSSGSQIWTQIIEFEQRKIYNISIFLSLAVSKMREKSSATDLPPKNRCKRLFFVIFVFGPHCLSQRLFHLTECTGSKTKVLSAEFQTLKISDCQLVLKLGLSVPCTAQ